jgi:pimeloyl-ACP methyl ester carboxylesterase
MPWDFPLVGRKALPDPYVKAWVFDKDGAHVDYGETAVEWDTLSPAWNADLVKVRPGQRVKIEVWDKDLKYDDLIGEHSFTFTKSKIERGSFGYRFGQVTWLYLNVRKEATREARVILQQPFPGPNSAKNLTRSAGRTQAVVLLHGLDLRDDGGDPATPRFVDWQGSTSPLVGALSKHADVYAIGYAQTNAVEEIAAYPELREAIGKVKKLGYENVALLGHSAGGLVARHLVEEHPKCGATRVIQIASPNGGAKLAYWAINLLQIPKGQAPFVESLAPAHRAAVAKSRRDRAIPSSIDFVTVVACSTGNSTGDGAVNRQCQWPSDLQDQGIPCICVDGSHLGVMSDEACFDVYCKLVTQPQPRWGHSQVAAMTGQK